MVLLSQNEIAVSKFSTQSQLLSLCLTSMSDIAMFAVQEVDNFRLHAVEKVLH